jgi:hypothetical protein
LVSGFWRYTDQERFRRREMMSATRLHLTIPALLVWVVLPGSIQALPSAHGCLIHAPLKFRLDNYFESGQILSAQSEAQDFPCFIVLEAVRRELLDGKTSQPDMINLPARSSWSNHACIGIGVVLPGRRKT